MEELKTLPRCHPALWQDTASLAERIVFSALYSAYASVGDSPDVSRRRLADHPRKEPAAGMNAGARGRRRSADPPRRAAGARFSAGPAADGTVARRSWKRNVGAGVALPIAESLERRYAPAPRLPPTAEAREQHAPFEPRPLPTGAMPVGAKLHRAWSEML